MKRLYVALALLLGAVEVAVMYAFERHIPAGVFDVICFPGVAVGSMVFGHSLAMIYTALLTNVLFYSIVTFGILRLVAPKAAHSSSQSGS